MDIVMNTEWGLISTSFNKPTISRDNSANSRASKMSARYELKGKQRPVTQARDSWASLDVLNLIGFDNIDDDEPDSKETDATRAELVEGDLPGASIEAELEIEASGLEAPVSPTTRRNALGLKQMREMIRPSAMKRVGKERRLAGLSRMKSFSLKGERTQKKPLFNIKRQQRSRPNIL